MHTHTRMHTYTHTHTYTRTHTHTHTHTHTQVALVVSGGGEKANLAWRMVYTLYTTTHSEYH
jgi:hypothetical protein